MLPNAADDALHESMLGPHQAPENPPIGPALNTTDEHLHRACAVLAHELRNPLSVIRALADVMDPASQSEARLQSTLRKEIERMTRLVDDLLDMSRSVHGQTQLRKQPFDLKPVVESVLQSLASTFATRGQSVHRLIDERPIWLNADPCRISQILINLLSNAAKYSDEGQPIRLTIRRDQDEVEICVVDQGIGIEADELPNVFKFFAQSKSPNSLEHRDGGLGIGLGLVKNLVEMHDGTVRAMSEGKDLGSTFVVRLPACEPVASAGDETPEDGCSPAYRVLVVDDRPDNKFLLKALVKKLGPHHTRSAADGPAALTVLEKFTPHVILLDLGLPGMSGLELAREIRQLERFEHTLLVALTGYDDDVLREQAAEVGVDLYRLKPVSLEMLQEVFSHPKLQTLPTAAR